MDMTFVCIFINFLAQDYTWVASFNDGEWSKGIQHGWLWSSDSALMPGVKSNHSLSPSDIHILKDRNVSKQEGLTIYSTERKLERVLTYICRTERPHPRTITQSTIKGKQRKLCRSASHQMANASLDELMPSTEN